MRKAFVMSVAPTAQAEYKRRHDEIPAELLAVFAAHGVHNYTIWLDRARSLLFASVEIDNLERWEAIAATGACRKWWGRMRDIMPTHANNSPLTDDLEEMFHVD